MKRRTRVGITLALVAVVLALFIGRGRGSRQSTTDQARTASEPVRAEAVLKGEPTSTIHGTARFAETPDGTQVHVVLDGATPGRHGVHLHAEGDCSAPDFSSAGGHFAPDGHPHGGPKAKLHHAGDLGNIDIDPAGHGSLTLETKGLRPGDHSAVGHAVIVHAGAADLTSQPSGDAGARVACGIVRSAG